MPARRVSKQLAAESRIGGTEIVSKTRRASLIDDIRETWAAVLSLPAIAPDDDFFALGGHSLLAAQAVARLNDRLGLDLAPRAIFEAPTVAEMADLIAEARGGQAAISASTPFIPDWVVPLQRQGAERPVFVFPSGHNEVGALATDAEIAVHVGRNRPFWGFRREHPALDAARAGGVPSLAAAYIGQMRRMQERGPYLLFGNCAGGYVAWEVARQLLAAGERMAGILFYEVPLRDDFDQLLPGISPANITREWHLSADYRPRSLPVDLTHLLTDQWAAYGWWRPWQRVVEASHEPVIIPVATMGTRAFLARRQAIIAGYVRAWIAQAEARSGLGEVA
jgi:acyl carrier protein